MHELPLQWLVSLVEVYATGKHYDSYIIAAVYSNNIKQIVAKNMTANTGNT